MVNDANDGPQSVTSARASQQRRRWPSARAVSMDAAGIRNSQTWTRSYGGVGAGKAIIQAGRLGDACTNSIWLSPDVPPVFFANAFVNLDGRAPAVQSVNTIALGAGNPIVLACIHVVVI